MLIEFTVRNFRSILDEQTLSLLSADDEDNSTMSFCPKNKEGYRYLKSVAIYGANGSGKSNWFYALHTLWQYIVYATDMKVGQGIHFYNPYAFDENSVSETTLFEIEFLALDDVRYRYRLEFDGKTVHYESLYFFPNNKEALLFERTKGNVLKFGKALKGPKQQIVQLLLPNGLFLSRAGNAGNEQLKQIYLFIKHRFIFSGLNQTSSIQNFTTLYLMNRENKQFKQLLLDFLKAADSGIEDIDIKKQASPGSDSLTNTFETKLYKWQTVQPVTYHRMYSKDELIGTKELLLTDESIGTQKMYNLGGLIIHSLLHGITLVVDELDSSFHPLMSEYILDLFKKEESNPKGAQLVFTTQDTNLLREGNFCRDQIWFAEKDEQGSTHIFSLYEFEHTEIKHSGLENWYLSGRFGALPFIDRNVFRLPEIPNSDSQIDEDFFEIN